MSPVPSRFADLFGRLRSTLGIQWLLFSLALVCVRLGAPLSARAQTAYDGLQVGSSPVFSNGITAIAVDANSNVYVTSGANFYVVQATNGKISSSSTVTQLSLGSYNVQTLSGVAVDSSGNVYVGDTWSNTYNGRTTQYYAVYEIVATNGSAIGSTTVNSLIFGSYFSAGGVALDAEGNVYVALGEDNVNDLGAVLKIPKSGQSCYLSTGIFNDPRGVAVNSSGTVYVADFYGVVDAFVQSSLSGCTTETPVMVSNEYGVRSVAFDPFSNLYLAWTQGIQEYTAASGGSGFMYLADNAQAVNAQSIAVDSHGRLFIADSNSNTVVELERSVADFGSTKVGGSTELDIPFSVTYTSYTELGAVKVLNGGGASGDFTVDAASSNNTCTTGASIWQGFGGYVCQVAVVFKPQGVGTRMGAVQIFDSNNNLLVTTYLKGTGVGALPAFSPAATTLQGTGSYTLKSPRGVALDNAGDTYFVDNGNNRVLEVTAAGVSSVLLNSTTSIGGSTLNSPSGVAVDGAGNVYIADSGNGRVVEVTAAGAASVLSTGSYTLSSNYGVAVDGSGDVYITDTGNNRVLEVTPAGVTSVLLNSSTSIQGNALNSPSGVAVDGSGNVYIADTSNDRVVEVTEAGVASELVISALNSPYDVAVDGAGDVYVTNGETNGVVELTAASEIFALNAGSYTLKAPHGLAVDGAGNVFIVDNGNDRVVKLEQGTPVAYSFDNTLWGDASADSPLSVSLLNLGNATLNVTGLATATTGQSSNSFPLDNASCTAPISLAAGQSCGIEVDFKPQIALSLAGTVTVTDNSYASAIQTISLGGTGTQATPAVTVTTPAPISYGTATTNFAASISYTGPSAPTGAVTFQVDSGTKVNANCTGSSSPLTCTASYPTATVTAVNHTITASIAADADYKAASNTAVLSVSQVTPAIDSWPLASSITYGETLAASKLTGGVSSVAGSFAWTTPGMIPNAGSATYSMTFTPTDGVDYKTVTAYIAITVTQVTPTLSKWPMAAAIVYGQTLASSKLTGGASSVAGSFAWTNPSTVPGIGTASYGVTFMPANATDYATVTGKVSITVSKGTPTVSKWPTAAAIVYGQTLASSKLTGGTASVAGSFAWTKPSTAPGVGTDSESVTFTPASSTDYATVTGNISLAVSKATPNVTVRSVSVSYGTATTTLTASIAYGGAVAPGGAVTLKVDSGSTVTAKCAGNSSPLTCTAAYTTSSLTVGSHTITASIGADKNYLAASNTGTLTVSKATPKVTVWPTASAITYGKTLASSKLTGGTASVAGSFAWTKPSTVPAKGTSSYSVTFTPKTATDYTTVAGDEKVTAN